MLTTKLYWGLHDDVNMRNTLNRKYLTQAIDGSLERLGHDFVDVLYCHRPDPDTPIEETVWAMSDIVTAGKALYWGTSEWSADEIRAAIDLAERHHLHKPVTEQPEYNLLARQRVEDEYARLFADTGYGATTWSPLASGLLTGKYRDGIPADSRGSAAGYEWLSERLTGSDDGAGRTAAPDRRRARLLARPARPGVVHDEPERVDRHHRRQPAEPGGRRTSPPSTSSTPSTTSCSPASTTPSPDRRQPRARTAVSRRSTSSSST